MNLNIYQKFCVFFFIVLAFFWVILFWTGMRETYYNYAFVFLYGLMPLLGGLAAMKGYREWGGLSTILGRAIFFIGLGLFLWGCGETLQGFYSLYLDIKLPHPSAADLLYLPSIFFYTIGTVYLSMTTGARMGLKNMKGKIFAVLASAGVLVITYYMIIVIGKEGEIVISSQSIFNAIIDIAHPLGDAGSLAAAILVAGLSFKYLGGTYKHDVTFILLGLATMFAADSYFTYSTLAGTSYSGDLGDIFYTLAMFLLTCGILGFNNIRKQEAIIINK
jgi:hypothetical protein